MSLPRTTGGIALTGMEQLPRVLEALFALVLAQGCEDHVLF